MAAKKLLYWSPRVLCILAILFVSIFSLDAFDGKLSIWHQIGAFLIHMIPSFVLLGLLLVAWKWELIGGAIFIIIGLVFTPFIFQHNYQMNDSIGLSLLVVLTITFPFVLVGILFIVDHRIRKRHIEASE